MVDLDEETIKKILKYRDLKSSKIENEEYLNKLIKDIEDSIKLFEEKIKKYTEYINNVDLTKWDEVKFFNSKKHCKKICKKNK